MPALGFKSGFQCVVFLFESVERVQSLKYLFGFNTFFTWNVPWHVAVTTSPFNWIVTSRFSKYAYEVAYIKQVSGPASRLMPLKRCQLPVLDPSSNGIGGNAEEPTGFRDRNSAGRGSGRICHQSLFLR